MRVMRNDGGVGSNLQMDQYRLTAHVEQLWNEWEIQFLVLVSFALQVFLLLFSGIRKRTTSNVLSMFLWLAYVSADSLAIFVLGHLTLHINGLRHELMLFWAPFMLLHLGGQDMITAFSMEDNTLWKRHLLNLATQVALAIYVVAKQWHVDNHLLYPMVLMFISGTMKYAGRTWALMTAAKSTTPGSGSSLFNKNWLEYPVDVGISDLHRWLMMDDQTYEELVRETARSFPTFLAFLMGMIPPFRNPSTVNSFRDFLSKENRVHTSYKMVEIQLALAYDYLYTKLGTRHLHLGAAISWILWFTTMFSTSTALALFVKADQKGLFSYSAADIAVSYILLIGAITLEIVSTFIEFSSYWTYHSMRYFIPCVRPLIFSMVMCIRRRRQWSGKLAQYSMVEVCIQQKQAGLLERIMREVGIKSNTTHVDVSHELKELVLDNLLQIATSPYAAVWDFTKFSGQWAKRTCASLVSGTTLQEPFTKSIDRVDFISSILIWHVTTDICFFTDKDCNSPHKDASRKLSNYIMYLATKHGIMTGNGGHMMLKIARRKVREVLTDQALQLSDALMRILVRWKNYDTQLGILGIDTESEFLPRAGQLASELLKIDEDDRWKLIVNILMEMVCYMATHCGAGFHTNHLSTGGEFITHVRVLMFILGLTVFSPQTEEPSLS